jgi:hypothetical protein
MSTGLLMTRVQRKEATTRLAYLLSNGGTNMQPANIGALEHQYISIPRQAVYEQTQSGVKSCFVRDVNRVTTRPESILRSSVTTMISAYPIDKSWKH